MTDDEADFVPDRAQKAHEAGIYDLGYHSAILKMQEILRTDTLTLPVMDPYPASVQYRHATDVEAAQDDIRGDVVVGRLIAERNKLTRISRDADAALWKLRKHADAADSTIARVNALAERWSQMGSAWNPWQEAADELRTTLDDPTSDDLAARQIQPEEH